MSWPPVSGTAPLRGQTAIVVAGIEAILAGEKPLHCANPEVLM